MPQSPVLRAFSLMSRGVLLLLLFASRGADAQGAEPGEVAGEQYLGTVGAGAHVAFVVVPGDQRVELVELTENALGEVAEQALGRAPSWLSHQLREAFRRMDSAARTEYATAINEATAETVDEIAFVVAHLSPQDRERASAELIKRNAELIYEIASELQYVELVENGVAGQDADFHTTAKYHLLKDGTPTTFVAPREVYYWWVVHPMLDMEWVTTIDPSSGLGADPPQGVGWREYFLGALGDSPSPASHYLLAGPNAITEADLNNWSFGEARAHGSLAPSLVGTNEVIRAAATHEPVLIHFSPSGGTCNSSYPMPDGIYLATTIPLERAAANGQPALLENLLLAGPGRSQLRDFDVVTHSPQVKEPRKVLIVRDRLPFGVSEDPNETLLRKNSRDYDVMNSTDFAAFVDTGRLLGTDTGVACDQLTPCEQGKQCVGQRCLEAPFINESYNKIVIPSDQPRSLYEAISSRREQLEAFVKHSGVFELHGATRDADDWSDLTMPGGLRSTKQSAASYQQQLEVYGNALLRDVMKDVRYLWDGVRRCSRFAKDVCPHGDRKLGPEDDAIDRLGWWAGQMIDRNVGEYRCLNGGADPQRSIYPQRIVRHHYGNCGEIQDVVGAASRAALVPSMLTLSLEDHVWNEFYAGDGQWYPYDTGWSDTPMRVGEWAVSGDGDSGGGKENAVMLAWRGDGQMVNLLGRYEAQWVDDKIDYEYARHMEIEVVVKDGSMRPVDGALVTLLTESYYSASSAVKAIFGLTDREGKVSLRVGAEPRWGSKTNGGPRNFYVNVASALGHWPKELDYSSYSPPKEQFQLLVEHSETKADAKVSKEIVLSGMDDDGKPYGTLSFPMASQASWGEASSESSQLRLQLSFAAPAEYRSGHNPMNGRTFFQTVDGGRVDLYVMDRAGYERYKAGEDFEAGLIREGLMSADEIDLPLPDASKEWVVVLSNARRTAFDQLVQADIRLIELTPGVGKLDPEPGGCSCALNPVGAPDLLPWALLALIIALRSRRRRR